jgi:hypothetical protein
MSHASTIRTLLNHRPNFAGPDAALRAEVASLPEEARRALGTLAKARQRHTNLSAAMDETIDAAEELPPGPDRDKWIEFLARAQMFKLELEAGIAELEEILNSIE